MWRRALRPDARYTRPSARRSARSSFTGSERGYDYKSYGIEKAGKLAKSDVSVGVGPHTPAQASCSYSPLISHTVERSGPRAQTRRAEPCRATGSVRAAAAKRGGQHSGSPNEQRRGAAGPPGGNRARGRRRGTCAKVQRKKAPRRRRAQVGHGAGAAPAACCGGARKEGGGRSHLAEPPRGGGAEGERARQLGEAAADHHRAIMA